MWSLDLQVMLVPFLHTPLLGCARTSVCTQQPAGLTTSGPSGASIVWGRGDIPRGYRVGADSQEGEVTSQLLGVVSEAQQ